APACPRSRRRELLGPAARLHPASAGGAPPAAPRPARRRRRRHRLGGLPPGSLRGRRRLLPGHAGPRTDLRSAAGRSEPRRRRRSRGRRPGGGGACRRTGRGEPGRAPRRRRVLSARSRLERPASRRARSRLVGADRRRHGGVRARRLGRHGRGWRRPGHRNVHPNGADHPGGLQRNVLSRTKENSPMKTKTLLCWMAAVALSLQAHAEPPNRVTPQQLATGQLVTPTAARGAFQQYLNPGLPAYPNFVAGEAVRAQLSPDGTTLAILCAGQNSLYKPDGTLDTASSTQYIFLYDVSAGHEHAPVLTQV